MLEFHLPDLTFPAITYGRNETHWDLRWLLYKGGAGSNARVVDRMIDAGELGRPLVERIELVKRIHETLANYLGRGGRRPTVKTRFTTLRVFFHWVLIHFQT